MSNTENGFFLDFFTQIFSGYSSNLGMHFHHIYLGNYSSQTSRTLYADTEIVMKLFQIN